MKKRIISAVICLAILCGVMLNAAGCMSVEAADLMDGVSAGSVTGKKADDKFIASSADFALQLFRLTVTEDENSLISPLSVMLALAMTANGADNMTKAQMEALLGGDIKLEELNEYLYSYVSGLPSEERAKLGIANSIWFRNDENRLNVKKDFLQKNADYYGASAYSSPFDAQTLKDINSWVKKKTDGMIDSILDEISQDAVMYLINAVVFDAKWQNAYEKSNIYDGVFTSVKGEKQNAEFMSSVEYKYISDKNAAGFIKDYSGSSYSFAALLPNEGVDINDYVGSLTGEGLMNTIKSAQSVSVTAHIPKFTYEYKIKMNEALADLGMSDAFDSQKADFSKLGSSSIGNIYIGEVLHKTFISVDELGTKAGAVTKVEMKDESADYGEYTVKLDRPFVYAIIDNASGLPVFLGTVMSIDK